MKSLKLLLLCLIGATSACETLSPQAGAEPMIAPESASNDNQSDSLLQRNVAGLSPLTNASIPRDSCGMILWTLESQRPVPVFHYIAGSNGVIQLGPDTIVMQRIDFSGATGFGIAEGQIFRSKEGLEVEISSQFGIGFEGGAYLERGVIKVSDPEGWSIVSPAAGIAGCR